MTGLRPSLFLTAALIGCATLPPHERAERLADEGTKLRDSHHLLEAFEDYGNAVQLDPTNLPVLRTYVELAQQVGSLKQAETYFRAQVRQAPGDAFAHEGLGLTLFAEAGEQGASADVELRKAIDLAPKIADFQYRLGIFYIQSDRFADAKPFLAKAAQLDPQRALYRLPYATALARTGERVEAVNQLKAVLGIHPTREEVQLAEKTARNLIDPFRGFPPAAKEQFEIAMNWLDHDAPTQATAVLESLLQKYPDLAMVETLLGLSAAKSDDASRAIYSLRRAIELDPDLAEPRMYLGDIYFSRGRPNNAREHYEAAIARNPFLADAYKRLAEVSLKTNDPDKATEYYGTYLLMRPEDVDATLARAKILTDRKSPDAAQAWDDAAETFPRRADILIGRGKFYFTRAAMAKSPGERDKAKAEAAKNLETVVDMDPENATATSILSQLRQL